MFCVSLSCRCEHQSFVSTRPQTKFGARYYVYRCVSVHRGCLLLGGACSGWVSGRGGVPGPRGVSGLGGTWWRTPPTVTAVGGAHPTGMHSCFQNNFVTKSSFGCEFLINTHIPCITTNTA